MMKHFFKRILVVIIAFIAIFLLSFIFFTNAVMDVGIIVFFFIFLTIISVILGLVLDSIILYRKQEKDKASESLLVLFILLLTIFLAITITFS